MEIWQQADGWQDANESYKAVPAHSAWNARTGMPLSNLPGLPQPAPGRAPWIETVADRRQPAEVDPADQIAALIHDARNMVTAIDLYCDLLDAPGVLTIPFRHYAGELRLVAGGSRRLLEKMARIECQTGNFVRDSSPSGLGFDSGDDLAQTGRIEGGSDKNSSQSNLIPAASLSSAGISIVGHRLNSSIDFEPLAPIVPSPVKNFPSRIRLTDDRELSDDRDLRFVPPPCLELQGPLSSISSETGKTLSRVNGRRNFDLDRPVESVADELLANQRLLSALVGPGITIGVSITGGNRPVSLAAHDFTRVLVNLARNAADAMPEGGHIQMDLTESAAGLQLAFSDSGIGIAETALEAIFVSGYTTKINLSPSSHSELDRDDDLSPDASFAASLELQPPVLRKAKISEGQGLGLAIVRSIVTAAGGSICASNQSNQQLQGNQEQATSGAVFLVRFPIKTNAQQQRSSNIQTSHLTHETNHEIGLLEDSHLGSNLSKTLDT